MIHEIKDMTQYNPSYTEKSCALRWKKINDGKNKKKVFPTIEIDKVKVHNMKKINEETLQKSREQYERTHELIPVLLRSYDYRIISGREQYALAKELGVKEIPYILREDSSISRKPYCSKTKPIYDCDGKIIYVSKQAYNKIRECHVMCKKLGLTLQILPIYRFLILDSKGYRIKKNSMALKSVYKCLQALCEQAEGKES